MKSAQKATMRATIRDTRVASYVLDVGVHEEPALMYCIVLEEKIVHAKGREMTLVGAATDWERASGGGGGSMTSILIYGAGHVCNLIFCCTFHNVCD